MNLNANQYNFLNAKFENQAILNNGWVTGLGGSNNGSVTIEINVDKIGEYILYLEYLGPSTTLKLDINGVSTGTIYTMLNEIQKNTLIRINLIQGTNQLKFYGEPTKDSPKLRKFSIHLVETDLSKYNLINGTLFEEAKINTLKNMVTDLGGINRGYVIIDVNVPKSGYYNMTINFNNGLKAFLIDINNENTGKIYITPDILEGQYYLEIKLINGINHLKFYGKDIEVAPDLGEFTISFVDNLSLPLPPNQNYSVVKGLLGNGATLNNTKNLVKNLGGPQNGYSIVNIVVSRSGNYNIELEFENGSKDLKIDISATCC